jgi:DNA-binding XRE family transcriptional regulator
MTDLFLYIFLFNTTQTLNLLEKGIKARTKELPSLAVCKECGCHIKSKEASKQADCSLLEITSEF